MHDLFLSIAKPLNREVVKAGEEREMEGPVLQFSFIAPAINTPRSRGHWHIPYSLSNSFLPINPWASSPSSLAYPRGSFPFVPAVPPIKKCIPWHHQEFISGEVMPGG